jgi:hypothetical protein
MRRVHGHLISLRADLTRGTKGPHSLCNLLSVAKSYDEDHVRARQLETLRCPSFTHQNEPRTIVKARVQPKGSNRPVPCEDKGIREFSRAFGITTESDEYSKGSQVQICQPDLPCVLRIRRRDPGHGVSDHNEAFEINFERLFDRNQAGRPAVERRRSSAEVIQETRVDGGPIKTTAGVR